MTAIRMLTAGVLGTALLSGCGGPSFDSGINREERLQSQADAGSIRVIARPPQPGMSQVEIVQGFLEASANTSDLSTAREYLTARAGLSWNPAASIRVVSGPLVVEPRMPGVWMVTSPLEGTVDAQGVWRVAAVGEELAADIQVEQVAGEWRISALPAGLILSRTVAERSLGTYAVQFLDPSFTRLVPEAIVVSATGAGLATTLVRRILEGPSAWLASAATTAVPDGTRLALESVPIIDGVAQVSLTEQVLSANDVTRRALSAQIVRTLAAVPGITAVRITVGSAPLEVPGVPAVQSLDEGSTLDVTSSARLRQLYAVDNGDPVVLPPTRELPPQPAASTLLPVAQIAVADSTGQMAAVSLDRRILLTGRIDRPLEPVASGRLLTSPLVTAQGVWVVDRGQGITAWNGQRATTITVVSDNGFILNEAVEAVDLAPDQVRVLVVVRQSGRSVAMLGRVERIGDIERISGLRRIDRESGSVVAATWRDADTVALVVSDAGSTSVVSVSLGLRPIARVAAPEGAVSIAGGPLRSLVVGTQVGSRVETFASSGNGWVSLGQISAPVYSR